MWLNKTDLIMIGVLYAAVIAGIAVFVCVGGRASQGDDEREDRS